MAKVTLLDPTDASRRLDRYELIGEIASGGMATVFLARLGGVGGFSRFVAIKRLHPHLATDPEFVDMFLNEARLAAGIHHPHVVPILEVGQSASGYYLVMEYVEGDTLARLVARAITRGGRAGTVPRPVLLRILLDTLAGLHAAHELTDTGGRPVGLVHRDVSPQNVLVGVDGSARITDFGVARATALFESTRPNSMKGKLAYMAPEQTRGADLDRRADLFSMGVILWEVLANQRLFKADNDAATLTRILVEPVPPPSRIGRDVPQAFDAVALKALDRDPTRRYQTAAEMADALERAARVAAQSFEGAVSSPREVADYVSRVIGDEIAAQRETVRTWLAQSERSQVVRSAAVGAAGAGATPPPAGREVTTRIPLDAPAPPEPPPSPATARGLGAVELRIAPVPIPQIADAPAPQSRTVVLRGQGPEPDPDEAEPTTVRVAQSSAPPAAGPEVAVVAPPPYTPPAFEPDPLSVPQPPMSRSRLPLVVALVVAAVVVVVGVLFLRAPASPPEPPPAATTGAPAPNPPLTSTTSVVAADTAATAATTAEPTPPAVEPTGAPAKGGRGGRPKPSATPTATAKPDDGPGEDLSNPYR